MHFKISCDPSHTASEKVSKSSITVKDHVTLKSIRKHSWVVYKRGVDGFVIIFTGRHSPQNREIKKSYCTHCNHYASKKITR